MKQPTILTLLGSALLVAGGFLLPGCGGGGGDFCEQAKECENGNEADAQACGIAFTENQKIADLKNCGSEYDNLADCLDENARCSNGVYQADPKSCENESDQLDKCLQ